MDVSLMGGKARLGSLARESVRGVERLWRPPRIQEPEPRLWCGITQFLVVCSTPMRVR
jgi:hypothetical protein